MNMTHNNLPMYATKRRRRNIKRNQPKDGQTKTNPSKRHRERLNAELDLLASLLPFEQNVLSKLDKLSILRLSVSYLRTKSYFQCILNKEREACAMNNSVLNSSNSSNSNISNVSSISSSSSHLAHLNQQLSNLHASSPIQPIHTAFQSNGQLTPYNSHLNSHNSPQLKHNREHIENLLEGDLILQALNGFLFILNCDGTVFYISNTVEKFLGFPQSDVCHQTVYDLVHSEDREELNRHLIWNSALPNDKTNMTLNEALQADNSQYLERNFTVRFRCLLDNTSGFLRLEIRGRIKVLHGQNLKALDDNNYNQSTPLALFAVCTPFGPPSLLEMPSKETLFKSKHRLDFSWIQLDPRGRLLLGYNEADLVNRSCYDLVHYEDLSYVSSAHQELLKTGASGLIAYRLCTKNSQSQWLQTSARLVYKNSKPDFISCVHRPLMEEEGRDLYGKRLMDFKVTYLDGLGAMSADRNFDCLPGEKSTEDRSSAITNNSSSTVKPPKARKIKSEKGANQKQASLTAAAAFAAINSSINTSSNCFEHTVGYTNNQPNNLTQLNRYNATSLTDYYGNAAAASSTAVHPNAYYNGAAAGGYPTYNSQTNVTIINNNYNLNVTQQNNVNNLADTPMHPPPSTTISNTSPTAINSLVNENSSCSSNSSFSSCSALIRKKFVNQTGSNEDYDQFNQLINGQSSHAFHAAAAANTTNQQQTTNHQQAHHLNNSNHLNINLNNLNSINSLSGLNQNAILLNNAGNVAGLNSHNQTNPFTANSNNFTSLNSFVYPNHSQQQNNLSPNPDQLNATINTSSHNQQFSSASTSTTTSANSTTPVHLHDQTNQLSPLSTASSSNQQLQHVEISMENLANTGLSANVHQSLNHHLSSSNSINDALIGSPQTTNSSTSPSNSSSSLNTNLSGNSTSPASAVALAYSPYDVANRTPHHFLHYSRLSSYYHPEYHLYNYFEPKFKNTVGNNLIGNNLIGNNNLFSNEHSLFNINNSSTNVF